MRVEVIAWFGAQSDEPDHQRPLTEMSAQVRRLIGGVTYVDESVNPTEKPDSST